MPLDPIHILILEINDREGALTRRFAVLKCC